MNPNMIVLHLTENTVWPFMIGNKNWLFSDSVAGAKASAN